MRPWSIVFLCVCVVAALSCVRRSPEQRYRKLTGTCAGACTYYLACKQVRGEPLAEGVHAACVLECAEIFSAPLPLMAFESLTCDDAVAFVEGQSGRVPGEPPAESSSPQSSR